MTSREEFMRQMGISMDDVTDPSNIKTKFPSKVSQAESPTGRDSAPPPPPARSYTSVNAPPMAKTTSGVKPSSTKTTSNAGYMAYAEEHSGPQLSPMKAPPPATTTTTMRKGGSSARDDFLRSLGIDNMDAPEAAPPAQPAVASRASQEYARPGARPAAISSQDSEDSVDQYRTMAPHPQPDITLGQRRAMSSMLPQKYGASTPTDTTNHSSNKSANKPFSMMDKDLEGLTVEDVKNLGNRSFEDGDYRKAVRLYSRAIEMDPRVAALYSNRSACYLQASKQMGIDTRTMALRDADKVIELRPDWFKGYSRRGDALFKLERFGEAAVAYERGLALDPTNGNLMHSLGEARNAAGGVGPRTQSNSWSTKAAAAPGESLRSASGKSARELLEEMKTSMRREATECIPIGDEYRERELQRFRERSSSSMDHHHHNTSTTAASSSSSSRRNPQQDDSYDAEYARSNSRLDRSQIPQEFGSQVAAAYQQSLLEEYRRKKAAKTTSSVYQTY